MIKSVVDTYSEYSFENAVNDLQNFILRELREKMVTVIVVPNPISQVLLNHPTQAKELLLDMKEKGYRFQWTPENRLKLVVRCTNNLEKEFKQFVQSIIPEERSKRVESQLDKLLDTQTVVGELIKDISTNIDDWTLQAENNGYTLSNKSKRIQVRKSRNFYDLTIGSIDHVPLTNAQNEMLKKFMVEEIEESSRLQQALLDLLKQNTP